MLQNCYTGNLLDEMLCHAEATHSMQSDFEGIDKEYEGTYGVLAARVLGGPDGSPCR